MSTLVPRVCDQATEIAIIEEKDRWVAVAFVSYASIPCDHFIPEFEVFAKEALEKVRCLSVNVEENPTLAEELLITEVPTTLVFFEGDERLRFEGPYSRETLLDRLQKAMSRQEGLS